MLQRHLESLQLPQGAAFYRAMTFMPEVYFPHSGILSMIVGVSSGKYVEAGMLENNGVIGTGAALDGPEVLNAAIAQVESSGMMIEAGVMKRTCPHERKPAHGTGIKVQALSAQIQQMAACNALHELEER